jgi:hypothetical protein
MMQKAKRRKTVEGNAALLASLLPGYEITVIADNGRDRFEVTSGPSEGYGAELIKRIRAKAKNTI